MKWSGYLEGEDRDGKRFDVLHDRTLGVSISLGYKGKA